MRHKGPMIEVCVDGEKRREKREAEVELVKSRRGTKLVKWKKKDCKPQIKRKYSRPSPTSPYTCSNSPSFNLQIYFLSLWTDQLWSLQVIHLLARPVTVYLACAVFLFLLPWTLKHLSHWFLCLDWQCKSPIWPWRALHCIRKQLLYLLMSGKWQEGSGTWKYGIHKIPLWIFDSWS